jgi:hypothetical protein
MGLTPAQLAAFAAGETERLGKTAAAEQRVQDEVAPTVKHSGGRKYSHKLNATLVFIRHHQIGARQFFHGEELPLNLLSQEQIDKMIDQKTLAEYPERRSLYKLFSAFSGAKEREPLDAELTPLTLAE